jgi:putative colanic acid biosynthesis acetyltransferase WcaF
MQSPHNTVSESTATKPSVDMAGYSTHFSLGNKFRRLIWGTVWSVAFKLSPRPCFAWRAWVMRCFGAKIGKKVHVYPTTRIWGPWNLEMGDHAIMGPDVDCYCMDKIVIGANATVSQYSYLCAGTHDISDPHMGLVTAPIVVAPGAWVCADVFVGPGVTVGEGAVVGARAAVFKDVQPWTVVGGNPAKFIKQRVMREG